MATEDPKKRQAVDRMVGRFVKQGMKPDQAKRRAVESARRLDRKSTSN